VEDYTGGAAITDDIHLHVKPIRSISSHKTRMMVVAFILMFVAAHLKS
jgi:hypothetical protein